jgi:hypothetical protein
MSDIVKYHEIINKEFELLRDKLKHLTNHGPENGRYREVILSNIIRKQLPNDFSVSTGFIVKQTDVRGEHELSTQADLIIYDNRYPVLFREENFAIVTADSVRGIIEVKTNFTPSTFESEYNKATKMGQFIVSQREFANRSGILNQISAEPYFGDEDKFECFDGFRLFNGIFYYDIAEQDEQKIMEKIEHIILNNQDRNEKENTCNYAQVNHISFNADLFYKYWQSNAYGNKHKLYDLQNLSYSFFISNLLAHMTPDSVKSNNHLWYPRDKMFVCIKSF